MGSISSDVPAGYIFFRGKLWKKHGASGTKLHGMWAAMKSRCYNKNNRRYKDWGGRGVKVCSEWQGFSGFQDWALKLGYRDGAGMQVDRFPNNNGDYSPDNCRLTTAKQNNNNRRDSRFAEWNGERKTLKQWSEDPRCVVSYRTLFQRVMSYHWEIGKALTTEAGPWNFRPKKSAALA